MKDFMLFLIACACLQTCCNTYVTCEDVKYIRSHIEDSRLEITYRDSVAIDSTVVYKVK